MVKPLSGLLPAQRTGVSPGGDGLDRAGLQPETSAEPHELPELMKAIAAMA